MRHLLFALAILAAVPVAARAHFPFLLTENGKLKVFFGDAAEPDDPDLLERIAKAEVWAMGGRGEPKKIELKKGAEALEGDLGSQAGGAFLKHTYGVLSRNNESYLLVYYGKTYSSPLPGSWKAVKDDERLPLEVTPQAHGAATKLTVTWKGKPLAGSVVTVVGPGLAQKVEGPTDDKGVFSCELPQAGVYSIRAKHTENTAGKLEDKEYPQVRYHSTLTFMNSPAKLSPLAHDLPALPKGTTSFGGAIAGDTLFVYGGNYGSAHEYRNEDQSGDLWKLDLKKPGQWEKVGGGPKLQGLAMVEHKGSVYRIGGFTATNTGSEEAVLVSQADFAKLKADGTWESLPSMPTPRSSLDAAVLGDTLYVVGGWQLKGRGGDADWSKTALAINLASDKPEWKEIAAPGFERRALSVAAHNGKLYAIGGMQKEGGPTTRIAVYDPQAKAWTEGPKLIGGGMEGFGSSAFASNGGLYVTTMSGAVQKLSADGAKFEYVGQLASPRFFHRLLPWGGSKLVVVGGSDMSTGKTEKVELLSTADVQTAAK